MFGPLIGVRKRIMESIKLGKGLCHVCSVSNIQLYVTGKVIHCKDCKGKEPGYLKRSKQKLKAEDKARYGFAE